MVSGAAPQWKLTASAKKRAIYNDIPTKWRLKLSVIRKMRKHKCIVGDVIEQLLDGKTRRITSLTTKDLLAEIASGTLSAAEAVQAFCKRCSYAHQLVGSDRDDLRV